jgi:hypothetical protein
MKEIEISELRVESEELLEERMLAHGSSKKKTFGLKTG